MKKLVSYNNFVNESELQNNKNNTDNLKKIVDEINREYGKKLYNFDKYTDAKIKVELSTYPNGENRVEIYFSQYGSSFNNISYRVDDDEIYFRIRNKYNWSHVSISYISEYIPIIPEIFKKYFPESKYADSKIWKSITNKPVNHTKKTEEPFKPNQNDIDPFKNSTNPAYDTINPLNPFSPYSPFKPFNPFDPTNWK